MGEESAFVKSYKEHYEVGVYRRSKYNIDTCDSNEQTYNLMNFERRVYIIINTSSDMIYM